MIVFTPKPGPIQLSVRIINLLLQSLPHLLPFFNELPLATLNNISPSQGSRRGGEREAAQDAMKIRTLLWEGAVSPTRANERPEPSLSRFRLPCPRASY